MAALDAQEGGGHYKGMKIQPFEYIHANGIEFAEGCVIKYVSRWRSKNGIEDLKKARHFLDLLIEAESPVESNDGWIEWHGGECPVNNDVDIVVLLRNGSLCDVLSPSGYDWDHAGDASPSDIVKYKIITKE